MRISIIFSSLYKLFAALAVVALLFGSLPADPVIAADTGLNSPASCASSNGNWSNPGNATASDNQYSTSNSNNKVLVCTFSLPAVPSGSVIDGIEVSIEGFSSGAREAEVELSWDGGTTYTTSGLVTSFGAVETTFTLGGAAYTWGRTWAAGDFTSANFRVRLTTNNGNGTISLDHVQVRVSYTADTTPPQTTISSTTPSTSPTSSTTMDIVFTSSEAGSTFQCRLDGGAYASCTSPVNLSGLGDGSHTFEVYATDAAGNADLTPASYTWTVDTTAPNTSIDSTTPSTSPTNSTTMDVSFSSTEAGSTFQCRLDGGAYASCISPASLTGLGDGSHTFEVYATDAAGNADQMPASYTWTVDTIAPNTSIVSTTPSTSPTNSTSLDVSFSSTEAGSTFQCRLDGGAYASCTSPVNLTGVGDGSHTFEVYATDAAGNADPTPASYTWTVDTTAPDTTITANPSNPSNDSTPTFAFSSPDATATFECQMDGGGFSACSSPAAFGPLSEGSHTFNVRAVDPLGNTDATPASFTWTIDLTPPGTSIDSSPSNPSNDANPTFTFSSPDGTATFECQVNGGGFSACASGSSFGPLVDGSHTFEVRAIDPAGNSDPTPASYTWTVDGAAPAVTINQASGQADPANSSPINFTVVFSEPVSGFATGDVTLVGSAGATTALVSEIAPNDGTTYDVAVSGMSGDGSVTATVAAGVTVDASNNGNTASTSTDNTVTYNTSAPDTIINSNPPASTNSQTATFTFSSADADLAGFECRLDYGGWSGCSTPREYLGLSAGSHTFEVRAFDDAGNYDPSPASYTWTVDVGFPTVLFTSNTVPANNVTLSTGPTQITVEFSEDVKNDGSAGAANNIANYLLVEDGANNTFNTLACSAGFAADDTNIAIDSASYTINGGSGPFIATLNINGGTPLPVGTYRLFICGTTSIEDLSGNELNNGEADTTITFTVQPINQGGGGGGGNSGGNSSTGGTTSLGGFLIPVTGFPQDRVTRLASQPADKGYASTEILIEIPKLGIKTTIVGVPKTDKGWDVSWLGRNAGWLNGSAFPTWKGNSVITAHVWDAYNKPGPFAGLINLQYGDQIRVHAYGQIYTYEITESSLILPSSISSAFRHEEKSVLTLITCEGYQEKTGAYTHRRLVRAVLVRVEQVK